MVATTVRRARPGDVRAVAALLGDLATDSEPRELVRSALWHVLHPGRTVLVAEDANDRVVGTVTGHRSLVLGHRRTGFTLDTLVVAADHRGRGIGGELLTAVRERAAASDHSLVWLITRVDRPDLHDFYERHGFVPNGVRFFAPLASPPRPGLLRRAARSASLRLLRRAGRGLPRPGRDGRTNGVHDVTWWDAPTSRRFLQATSSSPSWRLWVMGLGTGATSRQLVGLCWGDLGEGVVDLGRRSVALDATTARTVTSWDRGPDREPLVAAPDGSPLQVGDLAQRFRRDAAAAGLDATDVSVLRHTHAALLLRAGVTPATVAARLGHANATITLLAYGGAVGDPDLAATAAWARVVDGDAT